MRTIMKPLPESLLWNYFLLAARVLLAWTLIRYGWAKLTDNQFGVDQKTMATPLKDIGLFKLSWYLADQEPFKSFIGISQIFTALLLVFSRTVLVGAFISIPIWLNILVWDLTFMEGFTTAFTFRLSFYILLTLLIIYQHKASVLPALLSLTQVERTYRYPIWAYLALPVSAIGIEVLGALPNAVLYGIRLLT